MYIRTFIYSFIKIKNVISLIKKITKTVQFRNKNNNNKEKDFNYQYMKNVNTNIHKNICLLNPVF